MLYQKNLLLIPELGKKFWQKDCGLLLYKIIKINSTSCKIPVSNKICLKSAWNVILFAALYSTQRAVRLDFFKVPVSKNFDFVPAPCYTLCMLSCNKNTLLAQFIIMPAISAGSTPFFQWRKTSQHHILSHSTAA